MVHVELRKNLLGSHCSDTSSQDVLACPNVITSVNKLSVICTVGARGRLDHS
jgi:hypothetical protein